MNTALTRGVSQKGRGVSISLLDYPACLLKHPFSEGESEKVRLRVKPAMTKEVRKLGKNEDILCHSALDAESQTSSRHSVLDTESQKNKRRDCGSRSAMTAFKVSNEEKKIDSCFRRND